jgi:hypothetical protein
VPQWNYGTPDSKSQFQKPTKRPRISDYWKFRIEREDRLFQNGIQASFFGIHALQNFPVRIDSNP